MQDPRRVIVEIAGVSKHYGEGETHDEKILDRFDRLFHLRDGLLQDA